MKPTYYDITPNKFAINLFSKFYILNPNERNHEMRRMVAKESAIKCLEMINQYREIFSPDDGFFADAEFELKKL